MDKAEIIERMPLITHDETAEIAEPGEEPLNLPTATVAAQRTAILRLGAYPSPPMGCDHLDA